MVLKKPEKKEHNKNILKLNDTDLVNEAKVVGYNQACDEWEAYYKWATKQIMLRMDIAEEKSKEQYEQKWEIINGLPSEEEILEELKAHENCRLVFRPHNNYEIEDKEELAKAIHKRIKGE